MIRETQSIVSRGWNSERDHILSILILAFFLFVFVFHSETSGKPIHLVSNLDFSYLRDLRRRGGFRIDVRAGAGEPAQRAFRGRMFDSSLLHDATDQLDYI